MRSLPRPTSWSQELSYLFSSFCLGLTMTSLAMIFLAFLMAPVFGTSVVFASSGDYAVVVAGGGVQVEVVHFWRLFDLVLRLDHSHISLCHLLADIALLHDQWSGLVPHGQLLTSKPSRYRVLSLPSPFPLSYLPNKGCNVGYKMKILPRSWGILGRSQPGSSWRGTNCLQVVLLFSCNI